jgi:curved DNA-binding protein CbpA
MEVKVNDEASSLLYSVSLQGPRSSASKPGSSFAAETCPVVAVITVVMVKYYLSLAKIECQCSWANATDCKSVLQCLLTSSSVTTLRCSMATIPDYYGTLNCSKNATQEDIKQAYRKESLRFAPCITSNGRIDHQRSFSTHPDRLANASPVEKKKATESFQAVADAYYVLSDKARRREYDTLYASRSSASGGGAASENLFTTFASMFGANAAGSSQTGNEPHADAEGVFADVFEEVMLRTTSAPVGMDLHLPRSFYPQLLRPEVERHVPWWSWLGAICGAGIGFIIANIPGLVLGGFAGNRLGAIRDAKGKSVAAVFSELGNSQRAEVRTCLLRKLDLTQCK